MKIKSLQLILQKQRILRGYYEQLYDNKFNSLEGMDQLLNTQILSKLTHKEIKYFNRPIMNIEIESVIKILPLKKKTRLDGLHAAV